MSSTAPALHRVTGPELQELRPLLAAAAPALRLAGRPSEADACLATSPRAPLRHPDLVADLRRARAARFADPYEWLALRRRRAQIAARRALEGR